ncbi:MAG: Clp protease ClpP [Eubacteriales bacterium]|nr:Clp protease ClpP [Eubacteriales bacterium]
MRTQLNGYVVADDDKWLYDWFEIGCFSPATVREAVANNPNDEDLVLEINSGGGNAFAGFEIYSILRNAKCHTVAEVQSLAASAASTVMVGADRCYLSPVAQVMIHLPMLSTDGNYHDHEESISMLNSVTESILNGYQLKCGSKATREQLRDLMEQSTWMPAQEAINIGLADGVLNSGNGSMTVLNAIDCPSVADLMAKYEAAVKDGAQAVPGHDVAVENNSDPTGTEPENNTTADWQTEARRQLLQEI